MLPAYKIVLEGGQGEITEKKSRFIAQVFPVDTEEQVLEQIEKTKKEYWDARHNCYAYVLGANGEVTRCTDDGEPSGTAGRPILEVITGAELHNVLVIVTRYFGGTLLGTGGLVRAYSQATQAGLAACKVALKQSGIPVKVQTDYNGIGKLQYLAAQNEYPIMDTEYAEHVIMHFLVPTERIMEFEKKVTEVTAGKAVLEKDDECYFLSVGKEIIKCE